MANVARRRRMKLSFAAIMTAAALLAAKSSSRIRPWPTFAHDETYRER
jgi:hypothetical protein